jgi:DNA-binding NarL/FixJ family response regulator
LTSNFDLAWQTRTQPIRTISEISAHINISPLIQIPLYQKLSLKAKQLHALGMSHDKIAKELDTSESTIIRACRYDN